MKENDTVKKQLPQGYADILLNLQTEIDNGNNSLELRQTLSQLYTIGMDYYLQQDFKRAHYFKNKINNLCRDGVSERQQPNPLRDARLRFNEEVREQVKEFTTQKSPSITLLVSKSQKSLKHIQDCIENEQTRQEQNLSARILRRIKSQNKLSIKR